MNSKVSGGQSETEKLIFCNQYQVQYKFDSPYEKLCVFNQLCLLKLFLNAHPSKKNYFMYILFPLFGNLSALASKVKKMLQPTSHIPITVLSLSQLDKTIHL